MRGGIGIRGISLIGTWVVGVPYVSISWNSLILLATVIDSFRIPASISETIGSVAVVVYALAHAYDVFIILRVGAQDFIVSERGESLG
jgi:hypothetical protein